MRPKRLKLLTYMPPRYELICECSSSSEMPALSTFSLSIEMAFWGSSA